tara:strand:- start:909 stop:1673 length:765 start_codon:yes stop_codon:yes gene_type:complete
MKITEKDNELDIKVVKMLCDDEFKPAPPSPLAKKPFIYLFVGAKGSGKTTTAISLLTQKKPPYRAYYGSQHDIILNIPKNSLESINNKLIKNHDKDKVYGNFDINFLQELEEISSANAEADFFTMALIDDASSKLKQKGINETFTNLIHRHRHLKLSLLVLVQDLVSVGLSIRRNVDGVFFWRPLNAKMTTAFVDEYLPDFTKDEVDELFNYVFQKKGDFLFVKTSTIPVEYYKNFNKLEFTRRDSNNINLDDN